MKKTQELLALIISNILVIILALVQNWNLLTLLWVYWAQSMVIGITYFAKTKQANILIRYGILHLIYVLVLLALPMFSGGLFGLWSSMTGQLSELATNNIIGPDLYSVAFGTIIFSVSHLISIISYPKAVNEGIVPIFLRVVPMHLALVIGVFFMVLGIPVILILIFFLVFKTYADVVGHCLQHRIPTGWTKLDNSIEGLDKFQKDYTSKTKK